MVGVSALAIRQSRKPNRAWRRIALLVMIGAVALHSRPAAADKRQALLTVSVQVVESCRVETSSSEGTSTVDLKLRCSSTARPSVSLANHSIAVAPVGTVSLAGQRAVSPENGSTLNIEF